MAHKTDLYWQGHRIGSIPQEGKAEIFGHQCAIRRIEFDGALNIKEVAELPIHFDPDFAELRGITGQVIEPREASDVYLQTR